MQEEEESRPEGEQEPKGAEGSRAPPLRAQDGALKAGFLVPQDIEGLL